jgi:hypothetical protein
MGDNSMYFEKVMLVKIGLHPPALFEVMVKGYFSPLNSLKKTPYLSETS